MKQAIVIIGIGEMGSVFARGLLRKGHPLIPVTRRCNMVEMAASYPDPTLTLIAVAEADLYPVLKKIPEPWRKRICLLQNELLPRDWNSHDLHNPTVISVWFEKKKGQDYKVIVPSPIFGPNAETISKALATLDIPCQKLTTQSQLLFELVRKNVYILTTNIAGLDTGGTVATLWHEQRQLAEQIATEVIDVQEWLTGQSFDRAALIAAMAVAFEGDPEHKCMGRSAPTRLQNMLKIADKAGLAVPKCREICSRLQPDQVH